MIGILIYLGKLEEAETQVEKVKKTRIGTHIDQNGGQPQKLRRTKSVSYTVNNLWALARIADLGRRFTNVDLWSYQSDDGTNLRKGYDFVIPYLAGEATCTWKQITGGGAENHLANLALPMFCRSELMLGEKILPDGLAGYDTFTAHDVLTYAPPVGEPIEADSQHFSSGQSR